MGKYTNLVNHKYDLEPVTNFDTSSSPTSSSPIKYIIEVEDEYNHIQQHVVGFLNMHTAIAF